MQIYEFDSNLKREVVLKNTVSNMIKKRTGLFILTLVCIIAPIIVEIVALLNYRDTSPDKAFMVYFFGAIFLFYGTIMASVTLSKSIPEYGMRKNETFSMDNEKFTYTYTGKLGKYARAIGDCSLTVKFEDLISAERDVEKHELKLNFYSSQKRYIILKTGKRDTSSEHELVLPLYFDGIDLAANTIENICYMINKVLLEEENKEEKNIE